MSRFCQMGNLSRSQLKIEEKPFFGLISQNRKCCRLDNDGKWVVFYVYLERVMEKKKKTNLNTWVIWCQKETVINRLSFSAWVLLTNVKAEVKMSLKHLSLLSENDAWESSCYKHDDANRDQHERNFHHLRLKVKNTECRGDKHWAL